MIVEEMTFNPFFGGPMTTWKETMPVKPDHSVAYIFGEQINGFLFQITVYKL